MSLHATIRAERPTDVAAIAAITREAFRFLSQSSHTEHFIIDELRRSKVLSISLVAEVNAQSVGHIAFSPVRIGDGSQDWYGLGPMAVKPEFQGQGIGHALVHDGLEALRKLGAQGCVVLGEPEFYGRFGFRNNSGLELEGARQEFFLSIGFGQKLAQGRVTYHHAFTAQQDAKSPPGED